MSEIAVREVLVFGGALTGAVWGYFLGKLIERRRLAGEMGQSLEALERWAVKVCQGLDGLERSLARMGSFSMGMPDPLTWNPADAQALLNDSKVRVLSIKTSAVKTSSEDRGLEHVIAR